MKVGYIQTSPIFGQKEKNFDQIQELTNGIKANLLVLPELFATGYTFSSQKEAFNLAEPKTGDTYEFLKNLSIKTNSIIVGGFAEKKDSQIYNSAMIVYKNEFLEVYRKIHLFYKENLWFTPGDTPLKIFTINGYKIGIMICFDWIFPEIARSLALLGAEIIAHPSNLVLPYCQNAMKTRCIENHIYSITANRIGYEKRGEDDFQFTGVSQILDTKGNVLSKASENEIHIAIVNIDEKLSRNKNLNEFNNLFDDRRPDFYQL